MGKNYSKTASADQKLHLLGAGLCSGLSWEFGSWRKGADQGVGGKAEVAEAAPRGWFGIWGLVFALVPILAWPGVCHQSGPRAALLTGYIVSLREVLPADLFS